uniref:HTH myb-type domain-containing protein n=1 Tax=Setaria italica TaxID=4555 RepID=K4AMH2_SETIT
MLPARSFLRWSDDLHMIFVKAVAYQGEAKSTALKETMEAMGVVGLTIQNIKSHLQRYREKCELSAEAPVDEIVNNFLMDDTVVEHNSEYPQAVIDEYIADLANYAFGHL